MNTAVAAARNPVRMAHAMKLAVEAGREASSPAHGEEALLGRAELADRRKISSKAA